VGKNKNFLTWKICHRSGKDEVKVLSHKEHG